MLAFLSALKNNPIEIRKKEEKSECVSLFIIEAILRYINPRPFERHNSAIDADLSSPFIAFCLLSRHALSTLPAVLRCLQQLTNISRRKPIPFTAFLRHWNRLLKYLHHLQHYTKHTNLILENWALVV